MDCTVLIMLGGKLHADNFKTKESRAGLVRVPLLWKSHCVTCVSFMINNLAPRLSLPPPPPTPLERERGGRKRDPGNEVV